MSIINYAPAVIGKMSLPRLCLVCVTAAAVAGQALPDVVLRLSYEGSRNYMINFTFTSQMFTSFYQCLCSYNTSSCEGPYSPNTYSIQRVSIGVTKQPFLFPCKLYKCENSARTSHVICSLQEKDHCVSQAQTTYFTLASASSCSASCVGIAWKLDNEYLRIHDPKLPFDQCHDLSSVEPQSQPQTSTAHAITSLASQGDNSTDVYYRETYIVSGIAAGTVFIAIVVFLTILLVKRKPAQADTNNATSSSTNDANHSFHGINSTTHQAPASVDITDSRTNKHLQPTKPLAGFDFPNTKLTPQLRKKNNNKNNTWNKFPNDRYDNKNGNQKRTKHVNKKEHGGSNEEFSDEFDGSDSEFSDVSSQNHKPESDYAEIDDHLVYSLQKFRPESSETTTSDGYYSIKHTDYYNINEPTPSSPNSRHAKSGETSTVSSGRAPAADDIRKEVKHNAPRPSNNPVHTHQESGYSVSQVVHDDTSTLSGQRGTPLGGAVVYSLGQPVAGTSGDRKSSENQEHGVTEESDAEGQKRNSYFILETESDEDDA